MSAKINDEFTRQEKRGERKKRYNQNNIVRYKTINDYKEIKPKYKWIYTNVLKLDSKDSDETIDCKEPFFCPLYESHKPKIQKPSLNLFLLVIIFPSSNFAAMWANGMDSECGSLALIAGPVSSICAYYWNIIVKDTKQISWCLYY